MRQIVTQILLLLASLINVFALDAPTRYTYKTIDDLDLTALVYVPNASRYDTYPVVMALHFGGLVTGNAEWGLSTRETEEVLKRGWVAVSINYRLAPHASITDIIEDVEDAFAWIRTELVKNISINPDSIAVWGGSAGGGLALMAGYKLAPRPQVIASFYPFCANFASLYAYNPSTPVSAELLQAVLQTKELSPPLGEHKTAKKDDIRQKIMKLGIQQAKMGWVITTSDPDESPNTILKLLKDNSAVNNVDADYPPTYLVHGLADTTVPASQTQEMAIALNNKNIEFKIDLVPRAAHLFDFKIIDDVTWEQHIIPVMDFIEQHLTTSKDVVTTRGNGVTTSRDVEEKSSIITRIGFGLCFIIGLLIF